MAVWQCEDLGCSPLSKESWGASKPLPRVVRGSIAATEIWQITQEHLATLPTLCQALVGVTHLQKAMGRGPKLALMPQRWHHSEHPWPCATNSPVCQ